MSSNRLALLLIALLAITLPCTAATIRVPADQTTIQAGIDAAAIGDTVLVANGLYVGPGNRDITLGGKAITVRSENGPEICIIDCQGSDAEGHKGFIISEGEGPDTVIKGFTIRNGVAPGGATHPDIAGGAIYCEGSSPTIQGNILRRNQAKWYGGGICCRNADAVILNNTIEDNVVESGEGGGIYGDYSLMVVVGNVISGNTGEGIYERRSEYMSGSVTIQGNTISDNNGPGIDCYGSTLIGGNDICGNSGGGIRCGWAGIVTIEENLIDGNGPVFSGGGIDVHEGEIRGNLITGNQAEGGGGIDVGPGHHLIESNIIAGNTAGYGGGIHFSGDGELTRVANTTLASNVASLGGAISVNYNAHPELVDCILWGNNGEYGSQIYLSGNPSPARLSIRYSDVQDGAAGCYVGNGCELNWGPGMIGDDPLFINGPLGGYYLSRPETGQPAFSPCIDSGSDLAATICFPWGEGTLCLDEQTTRIDLELDDGLVDMGYHYPIDPGGGPIYLIVGPGPGPDNPPIVRKYPPRQDSYHQGQFDAYGTPKYGVNISVGYLNGGSAEAILTGPGPGAVFGPHVRGFAADGTPLPGLSFLAYGTNKYGVNVAAGDFDNDGFDEILTGAGPGEVFGPHVRAFDYDGGPNVNPMPGVSFMAYGTLKWGVNVAAGDLDGDGYDEIVTGAGPGAVFGPHVRAWNVDGQTAEAIPEISFFAYNTPRYGVVVSCGDVDGDGMDEIITGPGPSPAFGTHIRGWNYDGTSLAELPGLNFFAWPEEVRHGARVWAGTDLDLDGRNEIIVGSGPGPGNGSTVKVYDFQAGQVALDFTLDAFPSVYTHGVNVAAGQF